MFILQIENASIFVVVVENIAELKGCVERIEDTMAALINVPDLNSEITTEVFEEFVTENMQYILSVTPHNPIIPKNDEWNDAAYDDVCRTAEIIKTRV